MASKGKMTVTGDEEVKRAFSDVAKDVSDLQDVHRAEADMLLSAVVGETRRDTGSLAAGWGTDSTATQAQFINTEEYAGVQEWGGYHNIEPTHAILTAFESNQSETEALYAKAIADIADRANIDTT